MLKGFSKQEKQVIAGISFISVIRMLGLFLLLPVLAPYAKGLEGSSPLLVGMAVGIYGLAQALFQIPFGHLSDRYGRKLLISIGLIIYAVGSLMGAIAGNIMFLILARLVQGMGAISSTAVALAADLTKEETRTKAFAFIGSSIGLAFGLSLTLSPFLAGSLGVPFLFILTGILSIAALFYLIFKIPEPEKHQSEIEPSIKNVSILLGDKRLLSLYISTLLERVILVGMFIVIPIELIEKFDMGKGSHWKIYLPAILISIIIMVPLTIIAEKKKKLKEVTLLGIAVFSASSLIYIYEKNLSFLIITTFVFLIGFHILEPVLPSLLSRFSPQSIRGLSTGIFNTSQFIGAFIGSIAGGIALKYGINMLLVLNLAVGLFWFFLVLFLLEDKL